ncbi:hypothetical protein HMPREF1011_01180 [Anaerostipes caccae]|uniref:acyltransferase n=1 Tax=Anaerostipes caccae TaxID=105841 RepID=UPI0001F00D79|nr:UDP-N-acetylglucosamine pyrophosphorylase [Anaerostipes caccae]EFV23057.1 hypothetical protein HMPREF1011_01180 [Anaerostipes caccae]
MKQLTNKELFKDMDQTIAKELFEETTYPWEVLALIGDFILKTGPELPEEEFNRIGDDVWIAKSAVIARTAEINGPAIIGAGTEVRPGAFIRGNALIGENCVVGNSTEIKNDILFNNVQVPHYNYVGDSILGYKSHMGAGSITSNVKSDKTNVVIKCGEQKIETGRKKIGAILGDHVEVGCGTVLNPGSVVGANTNIYPLSMVRGYIEENSIYKKSRGDRPKTINKERISQHEKKNDDSDAFHLRFFCVFPAAGKLPNRKSSNRNTTRNYRTRTKSSARI